VARSRGFPLRSRSPTRRKTSWTVGPQSGVDGASISITASAAVLMGVGSAATEDGLTIVRTRGELLFFLTASTTGGGGFFGAFGIGIANTPAFTAGVASLPTPITEDDWDGWLYHRFLTVGSGGAIDAGVSADVDMVNASAASVRVEIDSKAMRKINLNETLFAALEVTEVGTATARIFVNSRILVKIP